jgi:hypothetical protein
MKTLIRFFALLSFNAILAQAQIPASNLRLHLKADAGTSTTTDGASLSSWTDQSGNGNNATAPGTQPVYKTNVLNGKPAIRFNGSSYLTLPAPSSMGIQNSSYEMFIVANSSSSSIQFLTGGSVAENELHLNGAAGVRFIPKYTLYLDQGTNGQYTNGAFRIYHPVTSDTGAVVRVDAQDGGGASGDYRSSDNAAVRLGMRGDGTYALIGDIAEVIIYNTVLTSTGRDSVLDYLSNKYNLTGGSLPQYLNPVASILSPTGLSSSAATLRGTVNPNGLSTSVTFRYGTNRTNLSSATSPQNVGSGSSGVSVTSAVSGLTSGTVYYYSVEASSSGGTTSSDTISFVYDSSIPRDNLKLWLSAGTGTNTMTAGNKISLWGDISGNGNDAVKTTASEQPVYQTNIVNSRPVIRFNGSSSHLSLPTPAAMGILNSNYEMFFVARSSAADIQFLIGGSVGEYELHMNGLAGSRFIPNNALSVNLGSTSQYTDGAFHIFHPVTADTGAMNRVDAVNSVSISGNGRSSNTSALMLGSRTDGTYRLNGDIAEVIIYNSVLSSSVRDSVLIYLRDKYNLSGGSLTSYADPSASILTATNITATQATLRGTVNPNGLPTSVIFRYGTSRTVLSSESSTEYAGNGTSNVTVTSDISGLTAGTVYYYSVEATSLNGTVSSDTISFFYDNTVSRDNLKVWLRAGIGTNTLTAGNKISTWSDLSGNGNDAVNATVSEQPVYQTNIINAQPVVRFDGSSSKLTLPTTTALGIQNSEYDIMIVARSASSAIQFLIAGATLSNHELHLNSVGARFIPSPAGLVDAGSNMEYTDGSPRLFSVRASTGGAVIRINGENKTIDTRNLIASDGSNILLGIRGDGSYALNGDIAEVMIFDTLLTLSRRQELESMLAARYGMSILAKPTVQASNAVFSNVDTSSFQLNVTPGNGASRIVVMRQGSAVNAQPAPETFYTANAEFGTGDEIGTGNFVVYNGTGDNVTVTGLASGSTYHVAVFEYNGIAGSEYYRTETPATASQQTTYPPAIVALHPAGNVTPTSASVYGLVDPSGLATTYRFAYGTNASALSDTTTAQSAGSGWDSVSVSKSLTGLTTGSIYYVRLIAQSIGGTVVSPLGSFILDTAMLNVNPRVWLRAENAGAANNDTVLTWYDLSLNGNHAVQTVPANAPKYLTNALNGKPVVRFNGISSGLKLPLASALGMQSAEFDMMIVLRTSSSALQYPLSGTVQFNYELLLNGGNGSMFRSTGDDYLYEGSDGVYADGAARIFSVRVSESGGTLRVNGNNLASSGANMTISPDGELYLGYRYSTNSEFFNGDIAEVIIFDTLLTASRRQQCETMLASRYGVTLLSVPTTQSSAVSFTSIDTASFQVNFTAGNGSARIVLMREGSAVNAFPSDETSYSANAAFGSGTEIGSGNFVVYSGTGNSVTVTGLTQGTTYHVAVMEFNGGTGAEKYLTASPATGNRQSAFRPAVAALLPASNASVSSVTVNGTVNPRGNPVTYRFAYGTNPSALSDTTLAQPAGSSWNDSTVNASLSGLSSGSLYFVRLIVNNGGGMVVSERGSFILDTTILSVRPKVWLRADNAGMSSNDAVSTWSDLSQNGNHAVQTIPANAPEFISNSMNGKPVIRFNGTTSSLTLPTAAQLGILNGDYEMIIVARSSSSSVQFLVAGQTVANYEYHLNGSLGSRFLPRTGIYFDAGNPGEFTTGSAHLFNLRASASGAAIRVNGANRATDNSDFVSGEDGPLYLGIRGDGSNLFDGDIAEVIIYDTVLTLAKRQQIEAVLTARYGTATIVEPTTGASALSFSSMDTASMTLTVTKGNGSQRLIIAKKGSAVNASVTDETTYSDNSLFGSGTEIGTGNFVVYKGSDSVVTVTGLESASTYHFAVIEFSGDAGSENYAGISATGSRSTNVPTPIITIASVTNRGAVSPTANGSVNPQGYPVTYRFAYGTNSSSLSDTTSPQSAGSGTSAVPVTASLTGLTNGTMYYVRLLATNTSSVTAVSSVTNFLYDTTIVKSSLAVWLRAEDAGVNDNDPVVQWQDQSGNDHHAAQGNSGEEPLYKPNVMNGKPVVRFNGSNSSLTLPSAADLGLQNSPYEIFIVAKSQNSAIQFLAGGSVGEYEMHLNGLGGLRFITGAGPALNGGADQEYVNGNPTIFGARVSADGATVRVNGVNKEWTNTNSVNDDADPLYLGKRGDNSYYLDGDIAEVLIYNEQLTQQQRLAVESQLAQRYGVTVTAISAPTVQASNVTFSNVDTMSMKITVTKGSGAGRMIVLKAGSAVNAAPVDDSSYSADSQFGNGSHLGSGNYIVYNGTDSIVTVTGLSPAVTYHAAVYEYNGTAGNLDYLQSSPAAGNQMTSAAPPTVQIVASSYPSSASVSVNGTVNPRGYAATYRFAYGTNSAALTDTTAAQSAGSGMEPVPVSAVLSGVTNGTRYYARLIAVNAGGTSLSGTNTFIIDSSYTTDHLRLWLRAEDAGTSDNDPVAAWNDRSGISSGAVQSNAPSQPSFQTNVINGKPVVRFNGTASELQLPTAASLGIQNSEYEMFVVARSASSSVQFVLSSGVTNTYELQFNGGQGVRFSPISTNPIEVGTELSYTDGSPRLYSFRASSVGGMLRINGVNDGSTGTDALSSDGSNLYLGVRKSENAFFLNGDIADVIIYDTVLTMAQRKKVEAALSQRYGISVPSTPTVQSGAVTFSQIDSSSMKVTVVKGNGTGRLIVAKQGNAVDASFDDEQSFSAAAQFGSGSQIGTGNYVVYNGTDSVVTVTGLLSKTAYHFAVYEYNGPSASAVYLHASPSRAYDTTKSGLPAVEIQAPDNYTSTTVRLNGRVMPMGNATTYRFVYGTDPNALSDTTDAVSAGSGTDAVSVNTVLSGLTSGALYHARILASGPGGTVVSAAKVKFVHDSAVVRSNLRVWLRADNYEGAANSSVMQWDDLSVNGNNAWGSWSPNQPTFLTNGFNGKPAMNFDGNNQELILPQLSTMGIYNSDYEVVIVGSSSSSNVQFFVSSGTPGLELHVNGGTGARFLGNLNNIDGGTDGQYSNEVPHLFTMRGTVGGGALRINGINNATSDQYYWPFFDAYVRIGRRASTEYPLTGKIAEILVFNSILTPDQRKLLEASLAERYGISLLKAPTVQTSNLTFGDVDTGSVKVTVTKGNGANRIILAKQGSAVDASLSDDATYSANAAFGSGTQIGTGNYVVYNGTDSVVTVTGLNGSTEYHFAAFEYNGPSGSERYQHVSPAAGSQLTNAGLPLVIQLLPTDIVATTATLNGTVNPRGGATSFRFAYGTNPSALSDTTAPQSAGNGTSAVTVTASLSGLTQGQLYFIKLIATNSGGTAVSSVRTVFSDTASIARTHLKMWLRADKGIKSADAAVSAWYDLSGSLNHALQETQGNRPAIVDSSLNDRPVVRFNGSSSVMNLPTASTIGIRNSPYEIFVVAKSYQSYFQQTLIYGTDTTYNFQLNYGAGASLQANTNSHPSVGSPYSFTNTSAYVFNGRAGNDAGKVKASWNHGMPVKGSHVTADDPVLTLGGRWYGGAPLNGDIAEVLIYDTVLTHQQRNAVEAYLGTKYNIFYLPIQEPTVQAGNVAISEVTHNSMKVTMNKGNGTSRLVVVRKNAAVEVTIEDEMYLAPNSALGTANMIDSVHYAVYSGADSIVTITGLDGASTYHVAVYEYNVYLNDENYLTASPARGSAVTLIAPPSVSIAAVTNVSATGATLNASVNPKNHSTSFRFAYGTNPAALSDSTAVTVLSAVDSAIAVSVPLAGITANTGYFARLVAVNVGGTAVSDIMSFAHDPAVNRTNLRVWLSADKGTGDTLSSWYDVSGWNHHAVTTEANKPYRIESVANNKPTVRFNGSPSYMKLPATSALGIQNSDYEMFIVARSASPDIQFLAGGEIAHYEMHLNGASGLRVITNGTVIADKGTSGGFTDNDLHIFSARASTTDAFSSVDTSDSDAAAGNAQSSSGQPVYLGMRSDGSYVLNGEIAEVIIYNSVLTAEARDSVETYLKNKYLINALLPMTYMASGAAHTDSSRVLAGTVNSNILRIAVDVVGNITPFSVTSFTLNTSGSSDPSDISKAKIFYTGTSSVFSAATQFGTDYSAPNGTFTITGSQQLSGGRNYFWLTYDIPLTAVHRDTLDAQVTSVTVNSIARTPSVISPAGRRVISNIPSPTAWLKADAGTSSTTEGSPVMEWLDQSGNGYNAGQGNEDYAPLYYPNGINGKPVLRFNGSTSRLFTVNASTMGLHNSDYEYFVLAKTTSQNVQFLIAGAEVSMYELHLNGSSGARGIFADGLYSDAGTNGAYADGAPHVFNARATDTYGRVRVDAVDGALASGNGRGSNPSYLILGVRGDDQYSFNGDIAEVMIYNRVLSASERAIVEEYLKEKYGVNSGALPVELVSFTASSKLLNAELHWKTATEVNNHGFEVERIELNHRIIGSLNHSTDESMNQWKAVSFIEGHGTTNTPNEYSFLDKNLKAGKYSYRLKQIDRDGNFSYSQEIEVEVGSVPLVFALDQNYPNPFNPGTTIGFTLSESGPVTLKVYDMLGREVVTLVNEHLEAGIYHQTMFNASRLASGIYFARLTSAKKTQIRKMMLVK